MLVVLRHLSLYMFIGYKGPIYIAVLSEGVFNNIKTHTGRNFQQRLSTNK